ncbi:MAG: IS1634 family transposase, partial [Thermoplasmata archaeon]
MFLRISRNKRGKNVYEYAQIAERYMENGKQKTRIIEHLGPVRSKDDMERYGKALEIAREREPIKRSTPDEFSLLPSLDFGIAYASMSIMRNRGILPLLKKSAGVYFHILAFMIIARLLEPSSDLSLLKLAERVYYPWAKIDLNDDNIYRTLDKIMQSKEELEVELFNVLKPDTSMVHYDLTSSYFEGREDNDLVLFGYSRDKKRGKEQIVIGLVMADGIPIYHQVWPGNTVDPKTLESTLTTLKERFHVDKVIFIGDRAFGRSPSLNLLDKSLYITAAYRWDNPYRDVLMETDFSDGIVMDDLIIKEVSLDVNEIADPGTTEEEMDLIRRRRYIAVYNRKREELDIRDI